MHAESVIAVVTALVGLATGLVGYLKVRSDKKALPQDAPADVDDVRGLEVVQACCENVEKRLSALTDSFVRMSGSVGDLSLRVADLATTVADRLGTAQVQMNELVVVLQSYLPGAGGREDP
ncbi:MAG: hypothetical protein M3256_09890 [Actinomycetota bacterium]|nr:hypothetical protein [Actinomycetota bacterium]